MTAIDMAPLTAWLPARSDQDFDLIVKILGPAASAALKGLAADRPIPGLPRVVGHDPMGGGSTERSGTLYSIFASLPSPFTQWGMGATSSSTWARLFPTIRASSFNPAACCCGTRHQPSVHTCSTMTP